MPNLIAPWLAAAVLGLSLTAPAAAKTAAKTTAPAAAPAVAPAEAATPAHTPPEQQLRDEQVVRAAMEAAAQGGPKALGRHVRKLQAVLDHAPASFPLREERDGLIILRADEGHDALAQTLISLLGAASKGQEASVVREYNTYPVAALMVASNAIERRRPEAALTALDKGLEIQPDNPMLVSEKATALYQLDRAPEALALLDSWLAPDRKVARSYKARMLRAKGYGLIETDRLDEAEAAYRAALELEPDHGLAKNQLQHIAELRAGGPRGEPSLTTVRKAATSGPLKP
jgi:tetratricopeptide (TPR) repeat protein